MKILINVCCGVLRFLILYAMLAAACCYATVLEDATGSVTGLRLPRFATLKTAETNVRSGPASRYPIKFVYQIANYPIEIIAEFENWRLIKDQEGSQGWVHHRLLSGTRYAMVQNNEFTAKKLRYQIPSKQAIVLRLPEEDSYPVFKAEIGVLVKIKQCMQDWCQIEAYEKVGWIQKMNLWGVYRNELLEK